MSKQTLRFSDFIKFQPKQVEAMHHVFPPDGDMRKQKKYIFYGGAKAGGKTKWAVGMAGLVALKRPGIKIAIARKTVTELQQQIILEFLKTFPASLYTYTRSNNTVIFHNGSRINFISFQHPDDSLKEQGIERQLYIIDEAPQMDPVIFENLRSSVRNPDIPDWKPSIIYTGNPGGVSDKWFKDRFVLSNYEEWDENELVEKDEYQFIQANVYDNPYLLRNQPDYVKQLESLPPYKRRAFLEGKWDGFSGQFFEEWNKDIHFLTNPEADDVRKDMESWIKWRSIDLGKGKHPSVCGWFTQAPNGDPRAGTVYMYRELGHTGSIVEFVQAIKMLSIPTEEYAQTFADPSMFGKDNEHYDTTQYFTDMHLDPADNSRQIGWRNMKQWLHWVPATGDSKPVMPRLRFFPDCEGTKKTIPYLTYKQNGVDDLNTKQADDYADMIRYATSHLGYGYIYEGKTQYAQIHRFANHPDFVDMTSNFIQTQEIITPYYGDSSGELHFEHEDGYETSIYSYY